MQSMSPPIRIGIVCADVTSARSSPYPFLRIRIHVSVCTHTMQISSIPPIRASLRSCIWRNAFG